MAADNDIASHGARAIPDVREITPRSDIMSSSPGNPINLISRQCNIRKLAVTGQGAEGGIMEDPERHLRVTWTSDANMANMFHLV